MLTSLYSNVAISISYTKPMEERRRRRDKGEKKEVEENSECLECIFSVLDHCSFLCDENMMMEHSNALDCYMSHHQGCLGPCLVFISYNIYIHNITHKSIRYAGLGQQTREAEETGERDD